LRELAWAEKLLMRAAQMPRFSFLDRSRAALKLEVQRHPTALTVGEWCCHASLVAYACCGGERTGFGYSRI
jgi:hypothetical protein